MRTFLGFLIFINLAHQIISLKIVEIKPAQLLGLFDKLNEYNAIKTDPQFPEIPSYTLNERELTFNAFFEEQCAIKCLRSIECVKYTFKSDNTCHITLRTNFQRHIYFETPQIAENVANQINCDLSGCFNGFYCSSSSITEKKGTCLCHSDAKDQNCYAKSVYELSTWSEWTNCTANCEYNEGFQYRSKLCKATYISSRNTTFNVENMDWVCNEGNLPSQFQVSSCSVEECRTYTDWSEWSSCSKICGGYSTRSRECFGSVNCNKNYLSQFRVCTWNDCNSLLIALDQTAIGSTNTEIIKRGYLKFENIYSNELIRIFSHSNDQAFINRIGRVTCKEFGFSDMNAVNAIKSTKLRSQFASDAEFYDYLDKKTINGIECKGDERMIKDCREASQSSTNIDLYELEIECTYDGYWTQWSAWSQCSATCGAGAKTRNRQCESPMPSISESGGPNGADCPPVKKVELTTCFMAKCEDNVIF